MAVTRAESIYANTTLVVMTTACAAGDLIVAIGNWATTGGSYSISDNVNSGNYTFVNSYNTTVNSYGVFGLYFKICNAAGTPTLTLSAGSSPSRISATRYTGFLGTPTFPAADWSTAQGSASTAVNSGAFLTSQAAEYAIAWCNDNGGQDLTTANSPFGTRRLGTNFQMSVYDTLAAFPSGMTVGTSVSLTGTLGAADNWDTAVQGFYDSQSSGPRPVGGLPRTQMHWR